MKFSVGTVLAFAAAVLAKPILLNSNYQVEEGKPFTLQWSNAQGPVTITLMTGDPSDLKEVTTITSGVTGNSFTFTLEDLPSGNYAIRISDSSGEPNYSELFPYVGTGTLTTTSGSTSATRSSTKTSASSTTSSSASSTSSSSSSSSESSSTTSSASSSASTSSTTTTSSTSSTRSPSPTNTPPNSNNGQRFASPLALVLVTVAALVFFH